MVMRASAPSYFGEGPHALWHVSEDPTIARFAPHRARTALTDEPLVWAVDTRHLPLYWFPRDCPRCTFWAGTRTNDGDLARFLDGQRQLRIHVVEEGWLERVAIDDLIGRHAAAGIALRTAATLWPLWDAVVGSTLEFSGIRLRNVLT